jgi:hypothetical protein
MNDYKKNLTDAAKFIKKVGVVQFDNLSTSEDITLLASLDIEEMFEPYVKENWGYHICIGREESHDHLILSPDQARELYKSLGRFFKEYGKLK